MQDLETALAVLAAPVAAKASEVAAASEVQVAWDRQMVLASCLLVLVAPAVAMATVWTCGPYHPLAFLQAWGGPKAADQMHLVRERLPLMLDSALCFQQLEPSQVPVHWTEGQDWQLGCQLHRLILAVGCLQAAVQGFRLGLRTALLLPLAALHVLCVAWGLLPGWILLHLLSLLSQRAMLMQLHPLEMGVHQPLQLVLPRRSSAPPQLLEPALQAVA